MNGDIIFSAKGIHKCFGATIALQNVDLTVRKGEIHGLIGENGSGKSTLSSISAGMLKADSGEMELMGKPHQPATMIEALQSGIGMIVQESGTIAGISVAENIFLGEVDAFRSGGIVRRGEMNRQADAILEQIGVKGISAHQPTFTIDYQDRKLIEIAKVMRKSPQMLIVDETTTALSQRGRILIYKLMRQLQAEGKSVLFISHDLDELMQVCNKLTVLRDGKLISTLEKADFEENVIKQLMVGRELTGSYYRDDFDGSTGEEVVLSVRKLRKGKDLCGVDLDLHKGEILGIGGLSHCGMHTLGKCAFGFEKPDSGEILFAGGKLLQSEKQAIRSGLGYVSKDRDIEALSLKASIKDNISIAGLDRIKSIAGLIFPSVEKTYVKEQIHSLQIKCSSMEQYVQQLSGGNKQKVVFAKWIGRGSTILVLDCPTRGVDIGVKQAMYQLIAEMKRQGASFLLISEELSELIGMCDRILIMKDGQISETFERSATLSESQIIGSMI